MTTALFDQWQQHSKWMRGPARIEGDEVVLDDEVAETYLTDESEHRQRLLMDLYNLGDCDPLVVVTFVRHHGLLWHGPMGPGGSECRESLADWRAEVKHLRVTVGMYVTLKVADEVGRAKPARDYLRYLRDLDLFYALIPDNDQECLESVSTLLAERITRGMEGCSWTLIEASSLSRGGVKEGGLMDFFFGENPPNLIAAAYTQLASVIANKIPFGVCEGCGKLFTRKHGNKRYCITDCNVSIRQRRSRAYKS